MNKKRVKQYDTRRVKYHLLLSKFTTNDNVHSTSVYSPPSMTYGAMATKQKERKSKVVRILSEGRPQTQGIARKRNPSDLFSPKD